MKATKKSGRGKERPVYSTFRKFFDYENEINKVQKKKKSGRFAKIKEIMRKGVEHGRDI